MRSTNNKRSEICKKSFFYISCSDGCVPSDLEDCRRYRDVTVGEEEKYELDMEELRA